MEVSSIQTPRPNELDIHQNYAYAATSMWKWKAVEFLMTKLEPVKLEDLDPDERLCAICQQEFHVSEDVRSSHPPIKTVCGHVFGKPCLTKWLNPLCYRGMEVDRFGAAAISTGYGDAKTGCPMCRRVFFPNSCVEPLECLAQRLTFWDEAYASAGVERSEREEVSRKHLWEYVQYCRVINDGPEVDCRLEYDSAQVLFWLFAVILPSDRLTPKQQELKTKLVEIGQKDLTENPSVMGGCFVYMTRGNDELQVIASRRWTLSPLFFSQYLS